ncbi:hypothetical protein SODALDRAFT_363262 [Sodiomyces alkalinus F11]|uniref:Nonsense-mediated mRNA decay factor n=1 Tax=Sodiomyces alkalinus (strain CBS 110278 / VKM F-3762 / F11) TaxID=1314773 RepID=A0A3N2PM72_SODAK|nr:hypothetical protein SODALDRAFT_363262 [Sodiomyces alkalinus F11]ROT35436.1 hypothetical protein SODALDRAFT_363262 [Sodiomyces alkalinus F11]
MSHRPHPHSTTIPNHHHKDIPSSPATPTRTPAQFPPPTSPTPVADSAASPTTPTAGTLSGQADVSSVVPQPSRPQSRPASRHSLKRPSARHGNRMPSEPATPEDRSRQKGRGANRGSRAASRSNPKPSKSRHAEPSRGVLPHPSSVTSAAASLHDDTTRMLKQLETRHINLEQLVAEVKGIYAGLVMVESKCIEVDKVDANVSSTNKASSSSGDDPTAKANNTVQSAKLNNEQWQALIALHRTLLNEHHDFFLASQHPSASPPLKRLAAKYAMPARMWRHGIHSFLELLRHRLPASLEHMLTFIYLSYSMMALLLETVPAFEDTWIECLGDLGRYRMAIEDDNMVDREVWTGVSRRWYSRASDKAPTTGRLYHHLAILARPNGLQQLFYYAKSLCVPVPFSSARESIMTLLDPILSRQPTRLPQLDVHFIFAHGVLFSGKKESEFPSALEGFVDGLDIHIARTSRMWLEPGYYIAVANLCALLGYGEPTNLFMRTFKALRPEDSSQDQHPVKESDERLEKALELNCRTHRVVWGRFRDPSILAYLHVVMVFLDRVVRHSNLMAYMEKQFPWRLLSAQLNTLLDASDAALRFDQDDFPRPEKEAPRPLPEDYAMRGLLWVDNYLPLDWFTNEKTDDEERYFELPSMMDARRVRCLWLGRRIARQGKWLLYDAETRQFSVPPEYEEDVDEMTYFAAQGEVLTPSDVPEGGNSMTGRLETLGEAMDMDMVCNLQTRRNAKAKKRLHFANGFLLSRFSLNLIPLRPRPSQSRDPSRPIPSDPSLFAFHVARTRRPIRNIRIHEQGNQLLRLMEYRSSLLEAWKRIYAEYGQGLKFNVLPSGSDALRSQFGFLEEKIF